MSTLIYNGFRVRTLYLAQEIYVVYVASSKSKTMEAVTKKRHFVDDIFKYIYLNENVWISIEISLKLVSKGPLNTMLVLVQILACRLVGGWFIGAYMRHSACMS